MIKTKIFFSEHKPELVSEWHMVKNGKLAPSEITYGSVKKVWWICPQGHEYEMTPNHRSHGKGCSYCSGKKVAIDNSLLYLYPTVAKEFHPTKNSKGSHEYAGKSNKKVWWLGHCGHEWEAPISNRTDKGHGCPYCTGVKLCKDNSLGKLYPELSSEWNNKKNGQLTPFDVTSKSERKVWWKCILCEYEWAALVSNRTGNNSGCPMCNESKGEKRIRKFLESFKIPFETQKEFEGLFGINLGKLSFDFYLFDYNLLIEYQGEFHDGNGNYYVKQKLETQKEHDRRKREYAKNQGINLLEIWYWDKENIEKILEKKIIKTNSGVE